MQWSLSMFYDPKVTYRNLELYYHEDFYMSTYSPKVMKISTILRTVPTYALDWATIVAHIPWISQYFATRCSIHRNIISRDTTTQQHDEFRCLPPCAGRSKRP